MKVFHHSQVVQRLGIRYPVVQGPFGGGFSTSDLVAAVSNAGGLGSYGAHGLEPGEIHRMADEIRQKTEGPFALNLWVSQQDPGALDFSPEELQTVIEQVKPYFDEWGVAVPTFPATPFPDFESQAEALMEARPAAFSFVFGIPSEGILEACRRKGIVTLGAATTAEEALALETAGVDMIVASGSDAGGHRPSFLKRAEDSLVGTFSLIPQIVDAVRIPVIAAGGIADARGIRAAIALGAQGVQIGTAFLACEESGASPWHRDKIPHAEGTVLTRAYSGRLARFIQDRLTDGYSGSTLPFPAQAWLMGPLKKAAVGGNAAKAVALYAGQAAALVKHRKADQLMHALVEGMGW